MSSLFKGFNQGLAAPLIEVVFSILLAQFLIAEKYLNNTQLFIPTFAVVFLFLNIFESLLSSFKDSDFAIGYIFGAIGGIFLFFVIILKYYPNAIFSTLFTVLIYFVGIIIKYLRD